jgi:peptide-methionine (S)-S-oxide reductase
VHPRLATTTVMATPLRRYIRQMPHPKPLALTHNLPRRHLLAGLTAITAGVLFNLPAFAKELAVVIPPPASDSPASTAKTETAVIAGGCFWGVQGVYQHVEGVSNAESGYAGGDAKSANYDAVSGGATGHAEAVRITYDPKRISYGQILQIFFSVAHNPTELNRQGPDTGTQYRSAIFPVNAAQMEVAKAYIAQLDKTKAFGTRIVTTLEPMKAFYAAEAYHQNYLTRNPNDPYIAENDIPKLDNLKKVFPKRYRAAPALVAVAPVKKS